MNSYECIKIEIEKWITKVEQKPDNAPIPKNYNKKEIIDNLGIIKSKLFSNDANPLKLLVHLSELLANKNIIELGYGQIVDSIKYVICYCTLISKSGDPDQKNINEAIDEAFNAYILPQFDSYLPKLRKAQILEDDENKTIVALEDVVDELTKSMLFRSANKIKEALNKIKNNEDYQSFL